MQRLLRGQFLTTYTHFAKRNEKNNSDAKPVSEISKLQPFVIQDSMNTPNIISLYRCPGSSNNA